MRNDELEALRANLARHTGLARGRPLIELGQALAVRHWRAGSGTPAAKPYLDEAIQSLDEAHGYLELGDVVRGQVAGLLGCLFGIRHVAHSGPENDRETGIRLLEEALAFPQLPQSLQTLERFVLGQLLLSRLTGSMQSDDFAGQVMRSGLSEEESASVDRAVTYLRQVVDGPATSTEITSLARLLLGMAEGMQTLTGGQDGLDLNRMMRALEATQNLHRQDAMRLPGTGLDFEPNIFDMAPLDRPVAVIEGPPVATLSPPRPQQPVDDQGPRRLLNPFQLPGVEDPIRPLCPWREPQDLEYYLDLGGASRMFDTFRANWEDSTAWLRTGTLTVATGPEGCGKTSLLNRCAYWLVDELATVGVSAMIVDLTRGIPNDISIVGRMVRTARLLVDSLRGHGILLDSELAKIDARTDKPEMLYRLLSHSLPDHAALIVLLPSVYDLLAELVGYAASVRRGLHFFTETPYTEQLGPWLPKITEAMHASPFMLAVGNLDRSDAVRFVETRLAAAQFPDVPRLSRETVARVVGKGRSIRFLQGLLFQVYQERKQEPNPTNEVTFEEIADLFFRRTSSVTPEW